MLRDERGMSVVEMLMSALILVIVVLGSFSAYEFGVWNYRDNEARATAQQDARWAVDMMSRYIRMTETLMVTQSSELSIRADADDDDEWETIRFYPDDGQVQMEFTDGLNTTTKKLAEGVSNTDIFVYYDVDGVELTNPVERPTKTKQIRVKLVIDTDLNDNMEAVTMQTQVDLRNLQ